MQPFSGPFPGHSETDGTSALFGKEESYSGEGWSMEDPFSTSMGDDTSGLFGSPERGKSPFD